MLSPHVKLSRRARSKSLVMAEQRGLPVQERVLKCGWLKKQRGLMKTWQLRWFVLQGDQLLCYTGEDKAKLQGYISLQGSQVHEVSPNPEAPGKHLFEIGPGIFGQPLEDTIKQEKKYGQHLAPLLVEQCADFIREHGLSEEGLFRMPGQANLVKELQESFDCGEKPLLDRNPDVHTVASVLKLYLRELPEPVVPFARYEDFLSCGQLLSKDRGEGTQELAKQVNNLPQANYNLLRYICKFLDEVQSHSSFNKMGVQNLATVFGPNILRPPIEDPATIMEGTSHIQHLMSILIREHQQIFGAFSVDILGDSAESPTSDWISKEGKGRSQWKNIISGPVCLPLVGAPSPLMAPILEPLSQGDSQASKNPGPTEHTPAAGKQNSGQLETKSLSPQEGRSSADIPSLPSSGNWLGNGLYSLQNHQITVRGQVRDSSSSHRLSIYDNVPSASLSLGTLSCTNASWEGSLAGVSVSSCATSKASDSSALSSSLQKKWAAQGSLPHSIGYGENCTKWSNTCCSSEPKSLAATSRDSVACSGALQNLEAQLQAELSKQRMEYEAHIKRVEETSTELRQLVAKLEGELDREKKRHQLLEIKLRNAERACEDAAKRNLLLQKEMEDFFATLGNLMAENPLATAPKLIKTAAHAGNC
ncbi:rho GTPase-activating protein 22 [Paroedura picta]|uniref:rho GTPase-activating protein 22 n=1 Tax=Paroedura picta TaxID=143630 RepID=UPI004056426F